MAAEMNRREAMQHASDDTAKYLGAMIPGEKRLVLIPLDPQEPWAAFKRMRSWMKDAKQSQPSVNLFEAPASLTPSAKVIPLRRKTS